MAVLPSALRSGEAAKVHTKRANERRSQSPRSVTALAHLGLLCTPDENRHATAGYGKGLFYGRRYDLPKVRHRSTGLRCIDDNAKQKMFQLCEELTAYDTCTESRFFVVVFNHRRIDAWKRNDHSTKDWLCHVLPVNCLKKTNRKITVLLFKFHLKSTWRNKSQLK